MGQPVTGFETWVAQRAPRLRRLAYLLTGDAASAEDLLQDTLVKLYLSWHRIEDRGSVDAYARTTMTRLNISRWRRTGRHETVVAHPPERAVADSHGEERDAMWQALSTLGERQRAVVVLRYYEQLTEREIADVLGCSLGTVKSQLHRGLRRLAERLPHPSDTLDAEDVR